MDDDRITHPEQLANGTRYDVWYWLESSKTKSGKARGAFSDVFKEFTSSKDGLFLNFYENAPVNWLNVTCIQEAKPRG